MMSSNYTKKRLNAESDLLAKAGRLDPETGNFYFHNNLNLPFWVRFIATLPIWLLRPIILNSATLSASMETVIISIFIIISLGIFISLSLSTQEVVGFNENGLIIKLKDVEKKYPWESIVYFGQKSRVIRLVDGKKVFARVRAPQLPTFVKVLKSHVQNQILIN